MRLYIISYINSFPVRSCVINEYWHETNFDLHPVSYRKHTLRIYFTKQTVHENTRCIWPLNRKFNFLNAGESNCMQTQSPCQYLHRTWFGPGCVCILCFAIFNYPINFIFVKLSFKKPLNHSRNIRLFIVNIAISWISCKLYEKSTIFGSISSLKKSPFFAVLFEKGKKWERRKKKIDQTHLTDRWLYFFFVCINLDFDTKENVIVALNIS